MTKAALNLGRPSAVPLTRRTSMSRGRVKWFHDSKGYGFIEDEGGRDIFVHYSSITTDGYKTLAEGEEVEFELLEGDKGLKATNVVKV
jgi:CspA family cold shock protein